MSLNSRERFILFLALALTVASALLLDLAPTAEAVDFKGFEDMPMALNVTVDPGGPVDGWRWDFEGDGTFDWYSSDGPNSTHTYVENGTYYAILRAELTNGTTRDWLFEVEVVPDNLPPVVTIIGPPEGFVTTDRLTDVELAGTSSDDGSVVLYEWDFNGDGTFDWQSNSTAAVVHRYGELGTFTSVLRATDDRGATGLAKLVVIVNNLAPSISQNPRLSSNDRVVDMDVTAHDPDGEIVSYLWSFDDGTDDITTSAPQISHQFPPEGWFQVLVEVEDNDGGLSSMVFYVEIRRESLYEPPVVDAGEDMEVTIGAPVKFEATPSGGTEAIVSYQWDVDGDGTFNATGRLLIYVYEGTGTFHVTLRVEDAVGTVVEDGLVVTVHPEVNLPPVPVPSVEQWVRPGRNLQFDHDSFDDDGTIVLIQWDFDGDGQFDFASSDTGGTVHVYPEEGIYLAVLQVTDNRGDVNSTSVSIRVSFDAPGEPGVDDTKGAAICCASSVVLILVIVYWTMRRSMASPRADGARVTNAPEAKEDLEDKEATGTGKEDEEGAPDDDEGTGDAD
jgi:PKD repeat protein